MAIDTAPVTAAPPEAAVDESDPTWRRLGKRVAGYAVLVFFAGVFIAPFLIALANSLKTRPQAASDPLALIPDPISLEAYDQLVGGGLLRATFVSVVVTVAVTLGRVALDSMAGYALARLDFPGRRIVFALIIATLAVPAIVLAIPRFLILGQLGLLNSFAGLILPLAVDAFGIFMMKQFFESIPKEMEEAARIDGATIFQTYGRIIFPLAAPGLIALTILSFQGSWNEFLHPLIAAPSDPALRPLPVYLALLRGAFGENLDFPMLMAGSLLTTLPVAIIFFAFQRHFISGVAASGVKG